MLPMEYLIVYFQMRTFSLITNQVHMVESCHVIQAIMKLLEIKSNLNLERVELPYAT